MVFIISRFDCSQAKKEHLKRPAISNKQYQLQTTVLPISKLLHFSLSISKTYSVFLSLIRENPVFVSNQQTTQVLANWCPWSQMYNTTYRLLIYSPKLQTSKSAKCLVSSRTRVVQKQYKKLQNGYTTLQTLKPNQRTRKSQNHLIIYKDHFCTLIQVSNKQTHTYMYVSRSNCHFCCYT